MLDSVYKLITILIVFEALVFSVRYDTFLSEFPINFGEVRRSRKALYKLQSVVQMR